MTRIISIVSGKGGVGKTTLVANLGTALASMGKNVVVLDANLTTPNLGMHLGMPLLPVTLQDVLKGNKRIHDAMYEHDSGLKVVPAGISLRDLRGVDARDLPNTLLDLLGNTDIILLDASAGLGRETMAAIESSDEMLIVTNPELTAVADALKAARLAQQLGTKVTGVVVNRHSGDKYEMRHEEIVSMLDDHDIIARIPEDKSVREAVSERTPVVQHKPHSAAAQEIKRLAASLIGYEYSPNVPWYKKMFRVFG